MNYIKSITISIVVTAVVIGIIELLLPKNQFKNQMRLITGTIILLSLISPLTYDFKDLNLNVIDYNNEILNYENNEKAVASSLNYEINVILGENGMENGKVIIETGLENSSIIIRKVNILLNKKDKIVEEKIKNEIGSLSISPLGSVVAEGSSTQSCQPCSTSVHATDLTECVRACVNQILDYAVGVLWNLPAEVAAAVHHNGVYLSGGVMKMTHTPQYIGSELKMKEIQRTKQTLLENLEMYYKVFFLGEKLEEV